MTAITPCAPPLPRHPLVLSQPWPLPQNPTHRLSGLPFRPISRYMIGIDLSQGMLDQAEKKKGLYEELLREDVVSGINQQVRPSRAPASSWRFGLVHSPATPATHGHVGCPLKPPTQ